MSGAWSFWHSSIVTTKDTNEFVTETSTHFPIKVVYCKQGRINRGAWHLFWREGPFAKRSVALECAKRSVALECAKRSVALECAKRSVALECAKSTSYVGWSTGAFNF
jgi:hypothetical protein